MSSPKNEQQAEQQSAKAKGGSQLSDKSLDKVSGGINPQPLPPRDDHKGIRER